MITANTLLGLWCRRVAAIKPGWNLQVDLRDLQDIPSLDHNDAVFTPADRILGNIVGSSFTHSFRLTPDGRSVVFSRHEDTGAIRYRAPDRR